MLCGVVKGRVFVKIAGLDIGTTGCKCTVFDGKGRFLANAYRAYPVRREGGGHEVDANEILAAAFHVIREITEKHSDIGGLGVTSFGETFVCTNEAGTPLHAALLYTDPRGQAECAELAKCLGEENIACITGLRPHEMYSICKMMWVKKHRPDVYAAARRIFLMEDFIVFHLTGRACISHSLAARTMAFNIKTLSWSGEILAAAGIPLGFLPLPVPTGAAAGEITQNAARETGLREGVKVVSAGHDQLAAAVGAGVFNGGAAVDGAGTVQCLTAVYDEMPDMAPMYEGHFAVVPYVVPGKYVAYAFSYTGGALMQWCLSTLAKKEQESAKRERISANEFMEREYMKTRGQDAPTGLLVLPHFAGAATPYMDTGSKGAVLGLTLESTVADIYRGCMEGVVYEMYVNLQALRKAGGQVKRLHATGGGARSPEWMQMKADVLNLPITALKTADAGTVGSAMLTGVALGYFTSLENAADYMVEETAAYEPRAHMHEKYGQLLKKYEKLYAAVRPLV